MNWFEVDIEISIFGKTTEYVFTSDKEAVEIIATKKVTKSHNCLRNSILLKKCKKIIK